LWFHVLGIKTKLDNANWFPIRHADTPVQKRFFIKAAEGNFGGFVFHCRILPNEPFAKIKGPDVGCFGCGGIIHKLGASPTIVSAFLSLASGSMRPSERAPAG
jgi:hypothetical protein